MNFDKILKKFRSLGIESHNPANPIGLWPEEINLFLNLLETAFNSRPQDVFNYLEVGTSNGGSAILTWLFLQDKKKSFPKLFGAIDLIDISFPDYFYLNCRRLGINFQNKAYQENEIAIFLNEKSSSDVQDSKLPIENVILIDGFHSYNQTWLEYNKFGPRLVKNGLILSHDHSTKIQHEKYRKDIREFEVKNRAALEKNDYEDFYVDESLVRFVDQGGYEFLNCEIECFHPYETGLNSWIRGTTSPSSAIAAIRKL